MSIFIPRNSIKAYNTNVIISHLKAQLRETVPEISTTLLIPPPV